MKSPKHKELFSKYDLNKSKQLEKKASQITSLKFLILNSCLLIKFLLNLVTICIIL